MRDENPDQQCYFGGKTPSLGIAGKNAIPGDGGLGESLGCDNDKFFRGPLTNSATWPAWLRRSPDQQRLRARLVGKRFGETEKQHRSPDQLCHLNSESGHELVEEHQIQLPGQKKEVNVPGKLHSQKKKQASTNSASRPDLFGSPFEKKPDQQCHRGPFGWETRKLHIPTNSAIMARLAGNAAKEKASLDQQRQSARLVGLTFREGA